MSLKTNRRDQLINTIQTSLLRDDFKMDTVKAEVLLLISDDEFFELMRYRLQSDKQNVRINSLRVITFMILSNKYNPTSSQNKEAFDVCNFLIDEYNIDTNLDEVLSRI